MNELLIERGVEIPKRKRAHSEFGGIASRMEMGDSVGSLSQYYAMKLRSSLSSKGVRTISIKEKNGLYRIWHNGAIVE